MPETTTGVWALELYLPSRRARAVGLFDSSEGRAPLTILAVAAKVASQIDGVNGLARDWLGAPVETIADCMGDRSLRSSWP